MNGDGDRSVPHSEAAARAREQRRYVTTLERLLAIQAASVTDALDQAAQLVVEILGTEKIDAFLLDDTGASLVALGVSDTPLGRRERARGLDRLPLAGDGRSVEVFQTGRPYTTGHADQDPGEAPGFPHDLGVRSTISVPLEVAGRRQGVLGAMSVRPDAFTPEDLSFVEAVARWMGLVVARIEADDARRAAEAAVRVRDDFLRAAAHDLRSPLASMRGRAQFVQSRLGRGAADPVWLSAQMDAVCAATTHMLATVDELSDVARLQIGQELDLEVGAVDVGALVRVVADEVNVPPDTAPVVVDAPDTPVAIAGDRARLRRVLENIVGNAVKYSPERTPVAVGVDDRGPVVVITVRDQGVGIPPDELPRLFTRYYRASTARGIAGSGLGLAGAKAIVEQHGGTIIVHSVEGRGTTVVLTLPHRAAPAGRPAENTATR